MASNRKKRKVNKIQIIFLIIFIPSLVFGINYYYTNKELKNFIQVTFKNPDKSESKKFFLEVADTPQERQIGLMYRKEMDKNRGMFFKSEEEKIQSFWMKNTFIPLDMIFLNSNYEVVGIIENVPILNEAKRSIPKPSKYVVELNAGQVKQEKIVEKSKLNIIQ